MAVFTRTDGSTLFERFALAGTILLTALIAFGNSAEANMDHSTGETTTTQYVIVVDDSGSMRIRTGDGPAADPSRLAVFATRSLLSLLDDRDEVTVVRLNGPREGEDVTPIAPLAENRSRLNSKLALNAKMAEYSGPMTPCIQALDAVQEELDEAYRPGVEQVVLFLTDGECNDGNLNVDRYLQSVDSYHDDAFQLYLLRWKGRVYSQYLVEMAEETGGSVALVSADDATELLGPFADVMSRSRGHVAHMLSPDDTVIPAHEAARRVRLMAVAPGEGDELSFQISADAGGEDPEQIGATETGFHQYESGDPYRYAILEYRPGTAPVHISVTGSEDWKVIALPEYRLMANATLHQGRCGESADTTSPITHSEIGDDICLTVELVNEQEQRISAEATDHHTEAHVEYHEPGADQPRTLPARQIDDELAFELERVNLEEGDHIFSSRLVLHGDGDEQVSIRGVSQSLQVSSQRIEADPPRLEFDTLLPGTDQYHEVTIDGNFSSTRGRLVVEGRDSVPDCIRFALNGVKEGEGQTISPGQTYTVEVHVAPYCGPSARDFTLDTALRVEFDRSSGAATVPSLVLPVRGELVYDIRSPARLEASLQAGDSADIDLHLEGNQNRDMKLTALFPAEDERGDWPAGDLWLQVVDAGGDVIEPSDDGSLRVPVTVPAADDEKPEPVMTVRAGSDACCSGGNYRTEMALLPGDNTGSPMRIPIDVEVDEAGIWQCWGPYFLTGMALALIALLSLYGANMWRNSRFINPQNLANQMLPMEWDDYGEARPRNDAAPHVRKMIEENMTFFNRAKAWLKANPLKFGLPGEQYYETMELVLNASHNVRRSRVRLIPEADFITELRESPNRGLARIYATARGGVSFYAVPAEDDRVGSFQLDRAHGGFGMDDDELFEPEVEHLRRRTELLVMHTDREPEDMAGWRIG